MRRTLLIALLALVCAFGMPYAAHAQDAAAEDDTDKLFEQVFGKRQGAASSVPTLEVPLMVDGVDRGSINIEVADDPFATQIERDAFISQIRDFLTDEGLEALTSVPAEGDNIAAGALFDIGIVAEFDSADLLLQVDIDPSLRKALALRLTNRGAPPESLGGTLGPDAISGYVNLRAGYDNVHETTGDGETGRRPTRVEFSGAMAMPRSALDYRFSYNETADRPWQRGDIRVLRDLPDSALRWTYGDLSFPTSNFQAFVPMGGVTVARNYSLQPYVVTEPVTSNQFVLRSPSQVEVVVNGAVVRTFRLPAGRYDLRDLPLGNGVNDVLLRITNDVGEVEELVFSLFFDSELLAPGIDQFSASAGLPAEEKSGIRTYDTSLATASGSYRRGITSTLTLGGDFQGNKNQQLLGGQALWASPFGTIEGRLATSYIEGANADFAARLGYRRLGIAGQQNRNFDLSLQYTGQRFAALGSTQPNGNAAFDTAVRYSQRLPMKLSGSIGGTFRLARNAASNSGNVSASLSRQLARGANLSLDVQRRRDNAGLYENRAFISLNISLTGTGQTISATRDTDTGVSRLDWTYRPEEIIGGVAATAGLQRSSGNNRLTGELSRTGYRSELSVSHDVTAPRNDESEPERSTSARLGTSLVFAGGHFALSRPVTDAFAIIVPHPSLKDQTVGINPRGEDSYVAEADAFGPAVVPDLTSYQVRRVLIDVPDLPIGAQLGKDVFDVVPTIRSGTTINVGTAASVLVEFTIVDGAGKPIGLQAGEITRVGDDGFEPLLVFSNRDGVMTSDGVIAGQYQLLLFAFPDTPMTFEIEDGASGILDLGTFKFDGSATEAEGAPSVVVPTTPAPTKPDADDLAPVREAEVDSEDATPEGDTGETQVARRDDTDPTPQATARAPEESRGDEDDAAEEPPALPAERTTPLPRERADAPQNVGTYRIQLAAFRAPEDAETAWRTIRARYETLLEALQAVVVEVTLGERGTFYRLQAGPIAEQIGARQLCLALRQRGQSCLVVAPAGAPPAEQPPAPGRERADGAAPENDQQVAAVPAVPVEPVNTEEAPAAPADSAPATAPTPLNAAPINADQDGGATNARVQLAALRTTTAANEELERLRLRHRDLLDDLTLSVVAADLGPSRGVFHRIQAGPLPDRRAAQRLCTTLRARGQDCVAVAGTEAAPRAPASSQKRGAAPDPSQPPALRSDDLVPFPVEDAQRAAATEPAGDGAQPETIVITSQGVSRASGPAPTGAARRGFRLQLATLSTSGAANAELRRLQRSLGPALTRLGTDVVQVVVDGAQRYRVEAGRFATREAALAECRPFQSAGQACLVVENANLQEAGPSSSGPLSLLRTPR